MHVACINSVDIELQVLLLPTVLFDIFVVEDHVCAFLYYLRVHVMMFVVSQICIYNM